MYSGGSGTIGDPYLISTPQDLYDIRSNLSAYFKLTKNIDLDGTVYDPWTPIGTTSSPFQGHIDGDGKIVNGLYINTFGDWRGFIGYARYGFSISKLGFTNAELYAPSTGQRGWGVIVGGAFNFTESPFFITECYAEGTIISQFPTNPRALYEVGGLIGNASGDSTGIRCKIENCWSDVEIEATQSLGGIVGFLLDEVDISKCHCDGNISGNNSACGIAGGLGGSLGSQPTITNCAANMDSLTRLSGTETSFFRINGSASNLINNYANSAMTLPRTPTSDANGIDGLDKTLTELKQQSTYQSGLAWDFSDTWYIRENKSFPLLQAFRAAANGLFFATNF
jgi:hypothetical protein